MVSEDWNLEIAGGGAEGERCWTAFTLPQHSGGPCFYAASRGVPLHLVLKSPPFLSTSLAEARHLECLQTQQQRFSTNPKSRGRSTIKHGKLNSFREGDRIGKESLP